jgi:hypothetical protein
MPQKSTTACLYLTILSLVLKHVNLDDAGRPENETLSYVWAGPYLSPTTEPSLTAPTPQVNLSPRIVQLPTRDGTFLIVTPSLQAALPFLAKVSKTGRLWIDQLCVNQDDDDTERSKQVAMMHNIYSGGLFTFVWLGLDCPAMEDIRAFCRIFGGMSTNFKVRGLYSRGSPLESPWEPHIERLGGRKTISHILDDALRRFISSAWVLLKSRLYEVNRLTSLAVYASLGYSGSSVLRST